MTLSADVCHIYITLHDGGLAIHRTQIYLEKSQYELLRSSARREGKSTAALIREVLDQYLSSKGSSAHRDPLHHAIGIGKGDGSAVAENYENFLYGEKS